MIAGSGGDGSGSVGRTLGHYRIVEELGRGGMGVVYRAEDLQLGRQVALKALKPEVAGHPDRVARFRREARSLAALNHPNIVTLYAVEELEGQLLLAMELVKGKTLGEVIPADGLELKDFFRLAIPLVDAVSAAHKEGVVHRDLKPKNVLVTPQGRVKVLDFGLAKLRAVATDPGAITNPPTEGQTAIGAVVGTPAYMAPEQIRSGLADERSDVFALGLLLYQMVAGQHPFHRDSSIDVVSAILRDDPPPLLRRKPHLPEHLDRILRSCLEKDPERRLQSAKDLYNQLVSLQAELVSGVVSQPSLPARPLRRRPAVAALAAVLALALVLALWAAVKKWSPAAPTPLPHLAVTEARLFSGQTGPEYLRSGLIAALAERLSGLDGVWVVPPGSDPAPDLVVEADVQGLPEAVTLQLQVHERQGRRNLGGEVLEGNAREPFEILDRAGAALTDILGDKLGLSVRYRPGPVPTRDPVAYDLFLRSRQEMAESGGKPDLGAALAFLQRALKEDPSFAPARALEGEIHRQRYLRTRQPSSLKAAAASCREAVEADDELAAAHLCLARVERARQRPVEAEGEYVRTIELDASCLEAHNELRYVIQELGAPGRAERTWERVIHFHPDHWAGYWSLGRFLADSSRHEAAVEQYRRALELAPNNTLAYLTLGAAYYFLGDYEDAITAHQRAVAIHPNHMAYSDLGSLYLQLRLFPEAVESLEQAVRFPEADYRAFSTLALAYSREPSRREAAAAAFERAAALCRERLANEPADANAWFWLAYDLAKLGRRERSLSALQQALDRRPNDPHFYYFAARVHSALGEREKALDWLERAVEQGHTIAVIRLTIDFDSLQAEPRFKALVGRG